jgi:hypothetical protein
VAVNDDNVRTEKPRRSVRLPFAFGDRVYHRARNDDKIVGIVTGFVIHPNDLQIYVRWGDDLEIGTHFFFELTTEFSPFTQEP